MKSTWSYLVMLDCNSGIFEEYEKHHDSSLKCNSVFYFVDTLMNLGIIDQNIRRDIQEYYWHKLNTF